MQLSLKKRMTSRKFPNYFKEHNDDSSMNSSIIEEELSNSGSSGSSPGITTQNVSQSESLTPGRQNSVTTPKMVTKKVSKKLSFQKKTTNLDKRQGTVKGGADIKPKTKYQ